MSTANTPPPRRLRILMLHGYTQSGNLFHGKTRALEKSLSKSFPLPKSKGKYVPVELVYPTAPLRIRPVDLPGDHGEKMRVLEEESGEEECWGWWRRKEGKLSQNAAPPTGVTNANTMGLEEGDFYYAGIEQCFDAIGKVLREQGPFDGVLGFSQGGCVAGMVASLLDAGPERRSAFEEQVRRGGLAFPESFQASSAGKEVNGTSESEDWDGLVHPPMRFAAIYSGFGVPQNPLYSAFYNPSIKTPVIHFLGTLDTVVEEKRSMRLADSCVDKHVVYHPGGHFLPASQRDVVTALVSFINGAMGWEERTKNGETEQEEKVEDMEMPF